MPAAKRGFQSWQWFLILLLMPGVLTAEEPPQVALISVIIDDLGDNWPAADRSLQLPGRVTYSILPHTPYAALIAETAHSRNKEVMLHQPMQAVNGKALGLGGLTLNMSRRQFLRILRSNIKSIPHVKGINNHMGSLLTRHPGHMKWLMYEMKRHGGLYLVDSRTTEESVIPMLARESDLVAVSSRDIFLDSQRNPEFIRLQFARGLALARRTGSAILIGHPYPETLTVLEDLLPALASEGIQLVPVSEAIRHQTYKKEQLWQASLSPSPKAVKSLKQ